MSKEYELENIPNLDSGCDYGGSENITVSNGLNQFNKVANELEKEYKDYLIQESALKDIESSRYEETDEDFKLRNYFENSQRLALNNGGKKKKMGVVFKSITVKGKGADQSTISDLSTPFINVLSIFNPKKWFKSNSSTFDILHDVTGFCKDGQMLLVLGRSRSGCSSLLRVICNQRESFVKVIGDVTYGGIPADEWDRYKGEAIYVPEEDCHHPTLTVHETLNFALKCKTPSNRLPDEKKRTFRSKIFNLLLSMFGLTHTANTMVGNEYVRGLSGGERKRVTISESMVAASSINCYDCSTRGLDSLSAYDYAKSIRIMSDSLNKTTIASFYQASDSIYNLFDKVMVLDKGRCIYFGPTEKAKQYFLDLGYECEPRKSIPDFIVGITNPQERIVKQGFEGRVPETSADLEEAWKGSQLYQESMKELEEYEKSIEQEQPKKDFIEEVRSQKSKTTSKKSPYTTGYWAQVVALTVRSYQIIWGDKFSLATRYFSTIVQAILYGTLFFKMSTDSLDGAYNRGGALFCTVLFNALLSEQELPIAFFGRRILQKQKSYAMYRPSALHFAQVASDLPVIFVQCFLFSFVVYFMYGLELSGSKFFIFVFTLIGFSLCFNNLYRLWGNFTPSPYIAQNIMNVLVITQFTYSGYYIPYNKQHPWLKWYYWINPITYCYKAIMANEFKDLDFDCSSELIPYSNVVNSTTYSDSAFRTCPTTAAVAGETSFSGSSYLSNVMDLKSNDVALNVCVLYIFWFIFIILNCIVMECFDFTNGGFTCKVYKRGKAPKLNDLDEEKRQNEMVANATNKIKDTLKIPGGIFTFQNISYTVPVPGGKRLLLDNVNGWLKPGEMTALMGPSGAGKSTLLDVLAKRKTIGQVEGKCFLNGKPLEVDFERITGYVEQMDIHNPGLTVREALRFSAKLRQEPEIPLEEKYEYVEQILEMMEMKHLGDALIGDLETGVGISVEERKRLTIGIELVAKPHILFLDEPTSGLDSNSSYDIIKFIRKLADAGMPLVCTIHQPSSVLFEHFDRLLLLGKGGKTVYFGEVGDKSNTLLSYFRRNGCRPCSDSENPAEYILECMGAGVHGTDKNWSELWKESVEYRNIDNELLSLEAAGPIKSHVDNGIPREFATSMWYQIWEVYKRLNLIWWRDPFYTYGTIIQCTLVGLMTGFSFWNLGNSSSDMNQRVFFVFEAVILGILFSFLSVPKFIAEREYFKRDYASKFYSWAPFAISIVIVEIPFVFIAGTLFYLTSFWTAGIESDHSSNFYFFLMFIMFVFYCVSFGQAIGAVCNNITLALNVLPILIVFFFLYCGLLVRPEVIPMFYREWIYKLNPCTYLMEGLVTSVLNKVVVGCSLEDFVKFNKSPLFSTCEEYAYEFINGTTQGTGYVETINQQTGLCGYCPYKSGVEYFENHLGWSFGNRWRNFGIMTSYFIFNSFLVIVFVYLTRKVKR